jgi:hypothetical protein
VPGRTDGKQQAKLNDWLKRESDHTAFGRVPTLENDCLHLGLLIFGLLLGLGVRLGAVLCGQAWVRLA